MSIIIFSITIVQNSFAGGDSIIGPVQSWADSNGYYAAESLFVPMNQLFLIPYSLEINEQNWEKHSLGTSGGNIYSDIMPGDIDGDGDLDLIAPISRQKQLVIFINDGDGNFDKRVVLTGETYSFVMPSDVDSDGDMDILYTVENQQNYQGGLYWLEQTTSMTFTSHKITDKTGYIWANSGDFDNDGDIDVIAAQTGSGNDPAGPVEIYKNDNQNFTLAFYSSTSIRRIWVADFNQDGLLDYGGSQWPLLVSLNQGDFTFKIVFQTSSFDGCGVADFNRDGYPDIMGGYRDIGLRWYENQLSTGGSFRSHIVTNDGDYADGGIAGDVDLDGFPDIVSTYQKIGWFKQNSDGTFKENLIDNFIESHWVYIDNLDPLDCDSDIDIVGGSVGEYAWWENKMIVKYSSKGWVESTVLDAGYLPAWYEAGWKICLPRGYVFRMRVRSSTNFDEILSKQWSEPLSFSGDTLTKYGVKNGDRYLQYKLEYERVDSNFQDKPVRIENIWVRYEKGSAGIIVEPDSILFTYPGDSVLFIPRIINNGSYMDTIKISHVSYQNWNYHLTDGNKTINNGDTLLVNGNSGLRSLRLTVNIPNTANAGDRDTIILYGQSLLDTTLMDSAVYIIEATSIPAVLIWPQREDSLFPGDSIDYYLWVKNNGNTNDVIDLNYTGLTQTWDIAFYSINNQPLLDTDGDGQLDLGRIDIGDSTEFYVRIITPNNAPFGYTDFCYIHAQSSVSDTVKDSVLLITHIKGEPPKLIVEPDTGSIINPNEQATYNLRIINNSKFSDTVHLFIRGGQWDYTYTANRILKDFDNDGSNDVEIEGFDTISITLNVIPIDSTGLQITGPYDAFLNLYDQIYFKAHSFRDSTVMDSALVWTKVLPVFNVHNFPNPFTNSTDFFYSLPEAGNVNLEVFNRSGEFVAKLINNIHHEAGQFIWSRRINNNLLWSAKNYKGETLSTGIYFYVFTLKPDNPKSKKRKVIKKMVISN